MTKNWVAVLSALLVAGACHAGGGTVPDKNAPTKFATEAGTAVPPVPGPVAPCEQPCTTCRQHHLSFGKCKEWLCFVPLRTCPCECKHCSTCTYPLYLYFLRPCVEGAPCYHADNCCASCVHKPAATAAFGSIGGMFHWGSDCSTCQSWGCVTSPTPGPVTTSAK
jgi:hypothetical protein